MDIEFLDLKDYEKLNEIGEGGFGKVFKVKNIKTGIIYAAKILSKNILNNTSKNDDDIYIRREVNIMAVMNHPAILKFIGYSSTDFKKRPKSVIVTEYLTNGSLHNVLNLNQTSQTPIILDNTHKLICIYGIASGMLYLHSHKIIHRDLKSLNVLMDDDLLPKIADFGLSKIIHQNANSMTPQSNPKLVGTSNYIAPEIWISETPTPKYTEASDIYAFAMVVYEIVTQKVPFQNFQYFQIMNKILSGGRPEFEVPIKQCYRELIETCWSQKPDDRPAFSEIVAKLRNDRQFITEDIDEKRYRDYINYIDEYVDTFDKDKLIILKNKFHQSIKLNSEMKQKMVLPNEIFSSLDKQGQILVKEAQTDADKQFIVGRNLIEGKEGFPKNVEIGMNYLENSINNKCFESVIYTCNMLINGDVIPKDLNKAKEYLSGYKNDSRVSYLKGKIWNKQKKYNESRIFFSESSKSGNSEAMYEYGKMLFIGRGGCVNTREAIENFRISQRNGNKKSESFLRIYDEMNQIGGFKNLPTETQEFLITQTMKSDSNTKLSINTYKLQMLNKNNSLETPEFSNALKKFSSVEFDIIYPSDCFEQIFDSIKRIRTHVSARAHLHITGPNNLSFKFGENEIVDEVTIDNSVTNINEYVFFGFKALTHVSIPSTVKSIGMHAFECCSSLKEITIPLSVMEIGINSFSGCTSLMHVTASDHIIDLFDEFGNEYFHGKDVEENKEEACRYYRISADAGNPNAMYHYGLMLANGLGVAVNEEEALRYYKMAADKGNEKAMVNYASMIEMGGRMVTKEDEDEVLHYIKMAADKEDPIALYKLAYLFEYGFGVAVNIEEACKLYKKSADRGYVNAMEAYSSMLENGEGTPIDIDESNRYCKMAADNGSTRMMVRYAYKLKNGEGVPVNLEEASRYTKMAAEKGNEWAMFDYGEMLQTGRGVQENQKEAARYFKMAADKGNTDAMLRYAEMLENGQGVQTNEEEAFRYIKLAADNENSDAVEKIKYILDNIAISQPTKTAPDEDDTLGLRQIDFQSNEGETNIDEEKCKSIKIEADNGDVDSMVTYGYILEHGICVSLDANEACRYYKMAANKGSTDAMKRYACLMLNKKPSSKREACRYFQMAADQGDSFAMYNYANMVENGHGAPINEQDACVYYQMAAEIGNSHALERYSVMLEKGFNDNVNYGEIFRLYKLAAQYGQSDTMKRYRKIIENGAKDSQL